MDKKFYQTVLGKIAIIIVILGYVVICFSIFFRLVVYPANQSNREYELRKVELEIEDRKADAMLMEARPDTPFFGE